MAATGIPKPAAASSSAPASLEGAPIPLLELRRQGRAELLKILEAARSRKALVLDTALRGLLGYVVPEGTKFLRQHGVVHLCRGLHADLTFPPQEEEPEHVLYLVRPTISNMRLVAAQIRRRNRRRSAPARNYQLYLVPHRTFICERVLEDEGVRGQFSLVGECRLDLFPFDTDLLSLELEGSFKDCYVEEDTTMLTTVARSLQKLEDTFGVIPNVKAKGPYAAMALHRFLNLKKERLFRQRQHKQSSSPDTDSSSSSDPTSFGCGNGKTTPEIDTVVILDRAVDLVTPLLTPLTYEGVVDELIGVQHGAIKVEPSLVGDDQKDGPGGGKGGAGGGSSKDPVTVALNSDDPLYTEIRGLHLEALGQTLNEKAMEMRQTYARVKSETRDGSLNDIHDVVRSIPALQQKYRGLNLHINIAEYLKPATSNLKFQQRWQLERSMVEGETRYEELEDMVAAYEPVTQVLRLLCLQSLTGGGIKAGKYDALKREAIQAYGYEYLFTLANLEAAGLLYRRPELAIGFGSSSSASASAASGGGIAGVAGPVGVTGNWAGVRKALRLVKESVRTLNPDDIAYVSSGYAPLSVRLLQLAHKPGWGSGNCADLLKQLPGPTVDFTQQPSLPTSGSGSSGSNGGASFLPVLAELDSLLAPPPPLMATAAASSSSSATAGAAAKSTTTSSSSGGGVRTSPLPTGLFSIGSTSFSSSSAAAISGGKQQSQTSQQAPQPAIRGKTLPDGRKVMLAYFVGGVSFMEIAAMRHLSCQPDFPYRIVVCTTKLVNGNTLVQSVQEDIKNGLVAGTAAAPAGSGSGSGSSYWTPR